MPHFRFPLSLIYQIWDFFKVFCLFVVVVVVVVVVLGGEREGERERKGRGVGDVGWGCGFLGNQGIFARCC